jgi:glycosyltransferase involved in cell wall biosynthesis
VEAAPARAMGELCALMVERKPKVLFVGAFPPPDRVVFGGMVTSCRALLRSSFASRVDLTLLDSTQGGHPPAGLLVRGVRALWRLTWYVVLFERCRPDAVLLFAAPGASVVEKGVMAWYARLRRVPALMFPRGGGVMEACRRSGLSRVSVRLAFRGARKILCQGPVWHKFACDVLGFEPEDAPIVPNWTATDDLLALGRERRERMDNFVRLLFVGWLDREKGVQELLEACRLLTGTRRCSLTFVGEGNMSEAARAFVTANALATVVTFRGWLASAALNDEYAAADVFVLPSWVEGLPNAMIEAMASRLAVVVSSVGSVPDVIANGREGLLVPPGDVVALSNAISALIDDADLRIRVATAGYQLAQRMFGVETAANALVKHIYASAPRTARVANTRPW